MDAAEQCESLAAYMEREIALLEHMVSYELTLKESIISHNWTRLELAQRKLSPILEQLGEVERERAEVFSALREAVGEDGNAGFYEIMVHLDRDTRESMAEIYRNLKFTVLKIQGLTNSIDVYLETITGAMQEILAELFPFRKGNLYNRTGTKTPAKSNPLVFSRSL